MGKKDLSRDKKTFKAVLRRYWYWFVAIPVLLCVSFVWLYFIGVFDSVNAIVIRTSTPEAISMPVDSMYHMVVTSNSDIPPVFSSNHTSVVEVTEDGFLIAHKEGSAVVTATFGKKRYQVAVNVYALSVAWYMVAGDSFTQEDVFAAFPDVSDLGGVDITGNGYLEKTYDGETEKYVVQEGYDADIQPIYIYATNMDWEGNLLKQQAKGMITLWLVLTEAEKQEKIEEYQKSFAQEEPVAVDLSRVDENLVIECGGTNSLRPKFTKEGFVKFYVEGDFDDEFPLRIDQTGEFAIEAMLNEFYIIAIVNNEEAYVYKCKANPRSTVVNLSVGEKMIIEDYYGSISVEVVRFSSVSSKLSPLYGDAGDFIGYTALERTDENIYIDCTSYEDKDYITFRFIVRIDDNPLPEGDENE